MKRPNLILTGFMGTGKTTVGRRLARQLEYEFTDTDAVIVARAGMPVAEIFATRGEAGFRRLEADLARELSTREGLVVATGGKLLLDPDNAEALSTSGEIFCLSADLATILARVCADAGPERPLLAGPDPETRIAALLKERREAYARFVQVDTTERSPRAVVEAILAQFNRRSNRH